MNESEKLLPIDGVKNFYWKHFSKYTNSMDIYANSCFYKYQKSGTQINVASSIILVVCTFLYV